MIGIEEAGEMVEDVENQVMNYSNAIKDMDKKMSYNLRLISSMIYDQPQKQDGEQNNLMKQKTIYQKQQKIIPKIKEMGGDQIYNKLELDNEEDRHNVNKIKKKLSTINQENLRGKIMKKGMSVVVMEKYIDKNL